MAGSRTRRLPLRPGHRGWIRQAAGWVGSAIHSTSQDRKNRRANGTKIQSGIRINCASTSERASAIAENPRNPPHESRLKSGRVVPPPAAVSLGSLAHRTPIHNAIPRRPPLAARRSRRDRRPLPQNVTTPKDQGKTQRNHTTGLARIALSRRLSRRLAPKNPLATGVQIDIIPKISVSSRWQFGRFFILANRCPRLAE